MLGGGIVLFTGGFRVVQMQRDIWRGRCLRRHGEVRGEVRREEYLFCGKYGSRHWAANSRQDDSVESLYQVQVGLVH